MDLHRTDRLLDQLGERSPAAAPPEDELAAALASWARAIDCGLPAARGATRGRRRLGRVLGGGALVLATLMGSSVAAALTGTDIPPLSEVGRVVVAWMPGADEPARDADVTDGDARPDVQRSGAADDLADPVQQVDASVPGASSGGGSTPRAAELGDIEVTWPDAVQAAEGGGGAAEAVRSSSAGTSSGTPAPEPEVVADDAPTAALTSAVDTDGSAGREATQPVGQRGRTPADQDGPPTTSAGPGSGAPPAGAGRPPGAGLPPTASDRARAAVGSRTAPTQDPVRQSGQDTRSGHADRSATGPAHGRGASGSPVDRGDPVDRADRGGAPVDRADRGGPPPDRADRGGPPPDRADRGGPQVGTGPGVTP